MERRNNNYHNNHQEGRFGNKPQQAYYDNKKPKEREVVLYTNQFKVDVNLERV
jgi:hypothetical protein